MPYLFYYSIFFKFKNEIYGQVTINKLKESWWTPNALFKKAPF
jgi:hypothetical protein